MTLPLPRSHASFPRARESVVKAVLEM